MDRVQAELKERPDLDTCGVIVDGSGVVHVDIVGTGLDEASSGTSSRSCYKSHLDKSRSLSPTASAVTTR